MIGSKIDILIPDPSFGHNLCFKYPNGLCELILDICVPINFQWYKELFNPMSCDFCNRPLKIWWSIWTLTPKVKVHLGVWRFIPPHSYNLKNMMIPMLHFWPTPLQALALVTNPRLGLRQMSKWLIDNACYKKMEIKKTLTIDD